MDRAIRLDGPIALSWLLEQVLATGVTLRTCEFLPDHTIPVAESIAQHRLGEPGKRGMILF
jgi:hypothetical protein